MYGSRKLGGRCAELCAHATAASDVCPACTSMLMDQLDAVSAACVALISILIGLIGSLALLKTRFPPVDKGTVGFFHPFADSGGGGERVLWCAVAALQEAHPSLQVVIYAREGVDAQGLAQDAAKRFNVQLTRPVQVVLLRRTDLILPERYPSFTLLGQALGSVRLGYEALSQRVPEVWVDTTGWAFINPLAKLAGARVASYVHYPTVSTDMLGRVWQREATYNNDAAISSSSIKSAVKVLYYQAFAVLYGIAGAFADVVMVNSSWTADHIRQLWWARGKSPALVYPPCDTTELQRLPLDRRLKQLYLISVAQFRPEKNHRLQLEAFARARKMAGDNLAGQVVRQARLKMVGSCRGADDEARLAALKATAQELGISPWVDWHVDVSWGELKALLGEAVAGLHTMEDEHFGISVVEYMAAGVIPIAHNSGGPRADIVVQVEGPAGLMHTGYLARTQEEYADAIMQVLVMEQRTRLKLAAAAQSQASQFSTERFQEGFLTIMEPILPHVDGEQEQQQQPRTAGSSKQQQDAEPRSNR